MRSPSPSRSRSLREAWVVLALDLEVGVDVELLGVEELSRPGRQAPDSHDFVGEALAELYRLFGTLRADHRGRGRFSRKMQEFSPKIPGNHGNLA